MHAIRSSLGLALVAVFAGAAHADLYNFHDLGIGSNWSNSFNWRHLNNPLDIFPLDDGTLPGSGDDASVFGNISIQLNIDSAGLEAFSLNTGSTIATNGNRLFVNNASLTGTTRIGDSGSQIFVEAGDASRDFDTDILIIEDGGELDMTGGIAHIDATLDLDALSFITGQGLIVLNNDGNSTGEIAQVEGTIRPDGGTLTLRANSGGTVDLDGSTGDTLLDVNGSGSVTLIIDATLADTFSGSIEIGSGDRFSMVQDWSSNGDVTMTGGVLDGGSFTQTTGGSINVNSGTNTVEPAMTLSGGSLVVASGVTLNLDGGAAINSGATVKANGTLRMRGGTLNGATIGGLNRFTTNDTVTVSGNVTINTPNFNWDGDQSSASKTIIESGSSLTINSDVIELGSNDGFDGTVTSNSGSSLTVNTTAPWNLEGTMNLHGATVTGSKIEVSAAAGDTNADVNALSGSSTIGTSIDFSDGADLAVVNGATLKINGNGTSVRVEQGADLVVDGLLILDGTGSTTYNGNNTITGSGTIRQQMNSIVTGGTTTINTDVYDWDGFSGSGAARTTVNSSGTLTINGEIEDGPNERFTGELIVNGVVNVNSQPWTVTSASISSSGTSGQINGQRLTINGLNSELHTSGTLTIGADLSLNDGVDVRLLTIGSRFNFKGDVQLDGTAVVADFSDSRTTFNGNLDAVAGNSTITVPIVDLDGDDGSANAVTVHPGAHLSIVADRIDGNFAPDGYDGQLVIDRGTLHVNTPTAWRVDNTLQLITSNTGSTAVISGSEMRTGGSATSVSVTGNGSAIMLAPTTWAGGASVLIGAAATLQLDAESDFLDVAVTGPGTIVANGLVTLETTSQIDIDRLHIGPIGHVQMNGGNLALTTLDIDDGSFSMVGGRLSALTVNGDLISNGGVIAIGETVATTTVTGRYIQGSATTLEIDLAGTTPGQHDLLDVSLTATLRGILDISLENGFAPAAGDTFVVLTAAGGLSDTGLSLAGATDFNFDIIGGTDLVLTFGNAISCDFSDDGLCDIADIDQLVAEVVAGTDGSEFDLNQDGSVTRADITDPVDGWLRLAGETNLGAGQSYLAADINLDGTVDGADFLLWNGSKFSTTGLWSLADLDANGVTDGADFLIWNSLKFTSADGIRSVPEPMIAWMLWLILAGFGLLIRSKPPRIG